MSAPSDIENFTGITGASQDDATKWLKAHNGNVEQAIGAYFDGPPNPPLEQVRLFPSGLGVIADEVVKHDAPQWDEDLFHSDKTVYGPQTQKQASFNVHSHDTLSPRVFDGTMSRPPSLISNRGLSPGPGGNSKQLSIAEQEEEDMNKAMAMSLNLPGQETGVTYASGQHFGPARQAHYDASQWAMSISAPRAQEILQNPEPELRKREPGRPAFLKPALGKHLLPPLLTMLHAIPMTREAFLLREYLVPDYGHNSEWWDGVSIETPKVLELDEGYDQDPNWDDILIEAQRLMAFLDHTDRAYGSAEALANIRWVREREDPVSGFLDLWRGIAARLPGNQQLREAFSWTVLTEGELKDFGLIDVTNLSSSQSNPYYTIYDALDDSLWSAFRATDVDATQVERVPEILIFRSHAVPAPDVFPGIKIPPIWYADRYLKENSDAARQMRLEKESFEIEIRKLKVAQDRLTEFSSPTGTLNGNTLLTLARIYFDEVDSVGLETEGTPGFIDVDSPALDGDYRDLAGEIRLEESKNEALHQLHELSRLYTESSADLDQPPHHSYTLRGVSTDYRTTYVLKNSDDGRSADLIRSESPSDWQWWKMTFTIGDANPISYTKVREVEVLKAARDGGREVLVVYASEKAISYPETTLPSQLQAFVQTDNQAFAAEFEKASSKPATPTKRKVDDTYDVDDSANDPDTIVFPAYQPDPISTTSPPKKLNDGAITATRDLSQWDFDPPPYESALSDPLPNGNQSAVEMTSPPLDRFTRTSGPSNHDSNPHVFNTAKTRATTTKNNPFFKAKSKPYGFDDMIPVSLTAPSPPSESQASAFAPGETVLLDYDDEDVIMHQPKDDTPEPSQSTQQFRSHEMQERIGNAGQSLRGEGSASDPYQYESLIPDLIVHDDEEKKGG